MSGFFANRLAAPPLREAGGRDLALEGLRGVCACLVLYAHMTIPSPRLDPAYAPSARFWWFNLGAVAVLFFFVLSGYVIGLTVREPFSGTAARAYMGRRLIRLVPVSTAAVLLSWAMFPQAALGTVLGNLLFLQNFKAYPFGWRVDVLTDNLNLWSLNFEALYYVGFLAVWWLSPRVVWVACLLGVVAGGIALPGDHVLSSSYAFGALYWVAGLSVAWIVPRHAGGGNWPSAMLATLCAWPLAPLQRLLLMAHIQDPVAPLPLPSLHRIDLLPYLVWLLLAVTGRGAAWQRRLSWFCLTWSTAALALGFFRGDIGEPGEVAFFAAVLAVAWALMRWEPAPSALGRLAPVGAISYGIYAVAFPIEYGVLRASWLPAGDAWTYTLRAVVLVGTTFGLAWVLEHMLQPAVRRAVTRAQR
jgi:peptidoglycan/LPS O-acetylase OafA/YrhL